MLCPWPRESSNVGDCAPLDAHSCVTRAPDARSDPWALPGRWNARHPGAFPDQLDRHPAWPANVRARQAMAERRHLLGLTSQRTPVPQAAVARCQRVGAHHSSAHPARQDRYVRYVQRSFLDIG